MKVSLTVQFGVLIAGGLAILALSSGIVGHCVCSSLEDKGRLLEFVCGTKITDLALVFLTYCLVIVGWFAIRSDQNTAEILERAYLWPGYGLMIEDRDGVRMGIHLGIRNTGRTVGIIKTVHHALITKDEDDDPAKVITYDVYSGREDAIIPDPNTEA